MHSENHHTLSDTELLTLALGPISGSRSAHEIAADLLRDLGRLSDIVDAPVAALRRIPGLGAKTALGLHAAMQIGRRTRQRTPTTHPCVRTTADAIDHLRPGLIGLGVEELHALYLDRRHVILMHRCLTRGNDVNTIVDPRQVFRPAVQVGAAAVIVAHNHPSGDPSPSRQDLIVTRHLSEAGTVLGVRLLDHLVITDTQATSILTHDGGMAQTYRFQSAFTACP